MLTSKRDLPKPLGGGAAHRVSLLQNAYDIRNYDPKLEILLTWLIVLSPL
jgi:hypothetical protein